MSGFTTVDSWSRMRIVGWQFFTQRRISCCAPQVKPLCRGTSKMTFRVETQMEGCKASNARIPLVEQATIFALRGQVRAKTSLDYV